MIIDTVQGFVSEGFNNFGSFDYNLSVVRDHDSVAKNIGGRSFALTANPVNLRGSATTEIQDSVQVKVDLEFGDVPAIVNQGGAVFNRGTMSIRSSTIAGNTSATHGGGVYNVGVASLFNSIVAGNLGPNGDPNDVEGNDFTQVSSFNMTGIGGSGGLNPANGNRLSQDWKLVLANENGTPVVSNIDGPTPYIALPPDSLAIDRGDPNFDSSNLPNDQRGRNFSRVFDGDGDGISTIDIGAYEYATLRYDFGDAPTSAQSGFPASYPVTLAQNGASHVLGDLYLGSTIDSELNGSPSSDAGLNGLDGDDGSNARDEDGIYFMNSILASNSNSTSALIAMASADGFLDGWIDFNQDGDWSDSGEQIVNSQRVQTGRNLLAFSPPVNALPGTTFARFRLSSTGNLSPTGPANDGEIEDYSVQLIDGRAANVVIGLETGEAGNLKIQSSGLDIVVHLGSFEVFRAAGSKITHLQIHGSSGDDSVEIDNLSSVFSGTIGGDGGAGSDRLRLTGSNQTLDLTLLPNSILLHVEILDITGSGRNTLRLSLDDVLGMDLDGNVLRIQHNEDDVVSYGAGWSVDLPTIAQSVFMHQLKQDDVTIQIQNTRAYLNPLNRLNTDRSISVAPLDALLIINLINLESSHTLVTPTNLVGITFYRYVDTSGDGSVTPLDALLIINFINLIGSGEGEKTTNLELSDNVARQVEFPDSLLGYLALGSIDAFRNKKK